MRYEEISKLLEINGKESPVFMPNELFEDLQNQMKDATHIAYAYSYTYLIHFLYRNCKYFNIATILNGDVIKGILGYKKSNRTMNYITMKDGILDTIGVTEPTKDYPMSWTLDEKDLSFFMYSQCDVVTKSILPAIPKKFFLKYPVKAMENRIIEKESKEEEIEELELEGTFFDVSYTHSVDFNIFMFCMEERSIVVNDKNVDKTLGVIGFYLYSWLKYKNNWHDGGYDVPLTKLSEETGIARRTLIKYMELLKGYRMIDFHHNQDFFVVGMYEEDRKATTYYTNEFHVFKNELQPFKKMGIMEREEYLEIKKKEEEARKSKDNKLEIDVALLPF